MTDATSQAAEHVAAVLDEYRFPRLAPWNADGGFDPLPAPETLRAASETLVRFAVPRGAAVTGDKLTASVSAEDANVAAGSTRAFRARVTGSSAPEPSPAATVPLPPDHRCVAMRLTIRKAHGGRLEMTFRAGRTLVGILSFEYGAGLLAHALAVPADAGRVVGIVVGEALACLVSAIRRDCVGRDEIDAAYRRIAAAAECCAARPADAQRWAYAPFATDGSVVFDDLEPEWERVTLGTRERNLIARADAALGRIVSVSQGFHVPRPKLFDVTVGRACVSLPPISTADVLRGVAELEAMPEAPRPTAHPLGTAPPG